ncbi:hypothetical protein DBR32_00840 [Taibaiella sp. KBW10]|uniref:YqjF family protein n=1 Tax=Taibaiella sp. KBW10 TaxID=2153357 RepID=UPI000F5985DE|nr:DUF2071 domain-containing protein [Taibaiella sp. KBW10]RQO32193.1 hypothetical protein DBR32_00840 [Taibaiella sp. KBW10]
MNFLTAEWRKLILINYTVDPEILLPYLPAGTVLDLWQGQCYLSVVGFMFLNTRLCSIPIPFHCNFEEVNLRFYVKRWEENKWKRGVVFLKEMVPKATLSFVANTFYKEHYETVKMKHEIQYSIQDLSVSYAWQQKRWQQISVVAKNELTDILPGSEAEFITEHYWGYTGINTLKTSAYEVVHPRWQQYPVLHYELNIDFGASYGTPFECLNQQTPVSVMLAEGSEIAVKTKKQII